MSRLLWSIVAIGVAALTSAAHAADTDFQHLLTAKSLRCTLGPGALADWRSGTPGAPVVSQGPFAAQPADGVTQFDAIDLTAHTARNIGNSGAGNVVVVVNGAGISFIGSGSLGIVVATVYGSTVDGQYVVAYSSHLVLKGTPRPSQYYGTCQIWQ